MTTPSFAMIRSATMATIVGLSSFGCATTDVPMSPQTSFEDLHKRIAASFPQVGAWREVSHITPLTLQFAATDLGAEFRAEKEFRTWCAARNGTFYSKKNVDNAPEDVQKAFFNSSLVLEGTGGLTPAPLACQAGVEIYVVRLAPSGPQATRIAWLAPSHLVAAQVVIRKQADENKAYKKRSEVEGAYQNQQYARNAAAKADMLKNAKRGATLACTGSVLAQGMSAPLTRAPLECRGVTVYMQELLGSGWTVSHQTQTPDGDFGGVARTLFHLQFVKK